MTEYAYKDFVWTWPAGRWQKINAFWPESGFRYTLWTEEQVNILTALRSELDNGWEPVSEVGPSAINLEYSTATESTVGCSNVFVWVLTCGIGLLFDLINGSFAVKYQRATAKSFIVKLRKKVS
ncbi:MAG: hypothetical protein ACD_61C00294G0002 [uncultured bacterium]|nr:MAG: hypothetical protein ACD_61C00294G0002 [uncultured bacterium]